MTSTLFLVQIIYRTGTGFKSYCIVIFLDKKKKSFIKSVEHQIRFQRTIKPSGFNGWDKKKKKKAVLKVCLALKYFYVKSNSLDYSGILSVYLRTCDSLL